PNLPPPVREKAVDALLNQAERTQSLLKALEAGQIEPVAIEAGARARLIENPDTAISGRARRIFTDQGSDRAKLVAGYRDVINAPGNGDRGKLVFEKNCARCHMPRRKGGARVGPDLSGVNNKTKEELLASILNPSYSIEPRFVNYLVTTKDGRMFDGVIANETPAAITLRDGSDEGDEIILRKNIAEIRASRISLMPDNLERSLSRQDLADLIAHLRAGL
ncbi:MAG: c-type cytochrome, partial [Gammaproteobacteria bacterium]